MLHNHYSCLHRHHHRHHHHHHHRHHHHSTCRPVLGHWFLYPKNICLMPTSSYARPLLLFYVRFKMFMVLSVVEELYNVCWSFLDHWPMVNAMVIWELDKRRKILLCGRSGRCWEGNWVPAGQEQKRNAGNIWQLDPSRGQLHNSKLPGQLDLSRNLGLHNYTVTQMTPSIEAHQQDHSRCN